MTQQRDDGDERRASDASAGSESEGGGVMSRKVEVPLRLYKTVIVFSTLFAVVFVVGGFIALDTATNRARLPVGEINAPLAVVGVVMIAAGALVYAFATRFQAEGMGNAKEDPDEPSNNG